MSRRLILSILKPEFILAAVALFISQFAVADQITLQSFYGGNTSGTITLSNGTNYHNQVGNVSFSEDGGVGSFLTYDSTPPNPNRSFESWCVDIFHNFSIFDCHR